MPKRPVLTPRQARLANLRARCCDPFDPKRFLTEEQVAYVQTLVDTGPKGASWLERFLSLAHTPTMDSEGSPTTRALALSIDELYRQSLTLIDASKALAANRPDDWQLTTFPSGTAAAQAHAADLMREHTDCDNPGD